MLVDPLQHVDEVRVRIDVMQDAGGQKTLDHPDPLGADLGPAEHPVLASHRDHP